MDQLSSDSVDKVVALKPDPLKSVDLTDSDSHLSHILIPRAPGTDNITQVREYIVSHLEKLKWTIELDEFEDDTPIGKKNFTNIIATKDPLASRRVILSAHYDSKWFPNPPQDQFVGATDSAAPCAMMLDVAESLDPLLDARNKRLADSIDDEDDDIADTTLQLVFFDGEEAFHMWTDTDSTYGSRHLAEKWASTYLQPHERRRYLGHSLTQLGTIEHLVLLDLLGAPNPSIKNYWPDTAWLFDAMVSAERRLGEAGHFAYGDKQETQGMKADSWKSWFKPRKGLKGWGHIGDDHVPFLNRGVSILHVISDPFPKVWHNLKDDASALDAPTMRRWNLILRVFFSEYLRLQPEDLEDHRRIKREPSDLT